MKCQETSAYVFQKLIDGFICLRTPKFQGKLGEFGLMRENSVGNVDEIRHSVVFRSVQRLNEYWQNVAGYIKIDCASSYETEPFVIFKLFHANSAGFRENWSCYGKHNTIFPFLFTSWIFPHTKKSVCSQTLGWAALPLEALPYISQPFWFSTPPFVSLPFALFAAAPGSLVFPFLSSCPHMAQDHVHSGLSQIALPLTMLSLLSTTSSLLLHT